MRVVLLLIILGLLTAVGLEFGVVAGHYDTLTSIYVGSLHRCDLSLAKALKRCPGGHIPQAEDMGWEE